MAVSREKKGSGLACWSPSPIGEPSSNVSMEDYRSLSRVGLSIENYWMSLHGGLLEKAHYFAHQATPNVTDGIMNQAPGNWSKALMQQWLGSNGAESKDSNTISNMGFGVTTSKTTTHPPNLRWSVKSKGPRLTQLAESTLVRELTLSLNTSDRKDYQTFGTQ